MRFIPRGFTVAVDRDILEFVVLVASFLSVLRCCCCLLSFLPYTICVIADNGRHLKNQTRWRIIPWARFSKNHKLIIKLCQIRHKIVTRDKVLIATNHKL